MDRPCGSELLNLHVPLERTGARDLRDLGDEGPLNARAPGGLEFVRPNRISPHHAAPDDLDGLIAQLRTSARYDAREVHRPHRVPDEPGRLVRDSSCLGGRLGHRIPDCGA